jgi:hypothetical protein
LPDRWPASLEKLVETCVVRKADGNLCEASIGKQKGSAGDVSSNLQMCRRHGELLGRTGKSARKDGNLAGGRT